MEINTQNSKRFSTKVDLTDGRSWFFIVTFFMFTISFAPSNFYPFISHFEQVRCEISPLCSIMLSLREFAHGETPGFLNPRGFTSRK